MAARFFPLYRAGSHVLLRLMGCRPLHVTTASSELLCWRVGPTDGEPWVMLHGLGSVAASWSVLVRDLRRDCRIWVPELSWLGGSDVPGGALAVRDGVEATLELLDREVPDRPVTLVGNSLGGWVALRLALEHPERVSRLVLVAPGGYREQDWQHIEALIRVSDLKGAERLLEAMFLHPPLPERWLRHGFYAAFQSRAVLGALDKMTEADALERSDLEAIAQPAALVWGEHDGIFDIEVAERMVEALPRGTLYRVETAGHIVQWESPRRLVDAVRDFRRRTKEVVG